jgi:hypothetical protein
MSRDNKAQVPVAETAMRIQGLSKEETLKSLNTSDKGLSAEEAEVSRLRLSGMLL